MQFPFPHIHEFVYLVRIKVPLGTFRLGNSGANGDADCRVLQKEPSASTTRIIYLSPARDRVFLPQTTVRPRRASDIAQRSSTYTRIPDKGQRESTGGGVEFRRRKNRRLDRDGWEAATAMTQAGDDYEKLVLRRRALFNVPLRRLLTFPRYIVDFNEFDK